MHQAPEVFQDSSGVIRAIVVRASHVASGVQFLTDDSMSLQLGLMSRGPDTPVAPHRHLRQTRTVPDTLEVLLVRSGTMNVELLGLEGDTIHKTVLHAGDVILLAGGAHAMTFPGPCDLLEVKQGPYRAESDKEYL